MKIKVCFFISNPNLQFCSFSSKVEKLQFQFFGLKKKNKLKIKKTMRSMKSMSIIEIGNFEGSLYEITPSKFNNFVPGEVEDAILKVIFPQMDSLVAPNLNTGAEIPIHLLQTGDVLLGVGKLGQRRFMTNVVRRTTSSDITDVGVVIRDGDTLKVLGMIDLEERFFKKNFSSIKVLHPIEEWLDMVRGDTYVKRIDLSNKKLRIDDVIAKYESMDPAAVHLFLDAEIAYAAFHDNQPPSFPVPGHFHSLYPFPFDPAWSLEKVIHTSPTSPALEDDIERVELQFERDIEQLFETLTKEGRDYGQDADAIDASNNLLWDAITTMARMESDK